MSIRFRFNYIKLNLEYFTENAFKINVTCMMVVFMLTSFRDFISKNISDAITKFYDDLKFLQHIFIFLELQLNFIKFYRHFC
jgi:hypothetical protein